MYSLLCLSSISQFIIFVKCAKNKNRYYIDTERNTICRLRNLYIVFFDWLKIKYIGKMKNLTEKY